MSELALLTAIAVGFCAGLTGAVLMLRRGRVDVPDERRLHQAPTPRGGGLGVPLAGLVALAVALTSTGSRLAVVAVLVWALPNGVLGFVDDFRPLRSRVKFGIQAAFAVAAVLLGLRLEAFGLPPAVTVPLSVLWLLWLANLYNFMDGLDALAAVSGALFLAVLAWWCAGSGLGALAVVAAGTGAGLLGFLRFNWPPAKIFMGDAGSLFVGALLGALALALSGRGVSITASTLLMGTFVWDATYTIVRRLLRGDPMLPHRTHLYQRLVLAGWSHGRVRRLYVGLAVAFAAAALALALPGLPRVSRALLIAAGLAAALWMTWLTDRAERSR